MNKGLSKTIHTEENRLLTEWLKSKRISQGLTMRQLAKLLEVPHSYIGKIERQERRIDVIEYMKYCQVLQINPFEGLTHIASYNNQNTF